jgi:hypothetical protein
MWMRMETWIWMRMQKQMQAVTVPHLAWTPTRPAQCPSSMIHEQPKARKQMKRSAVGPSASQIPHRVGRVGRGRRLRVYM